MRIMLKARSKTYPIIIAPKAVQKFAWPKTAVVVCDDQLLPLVKKQFRRQTIIAIPAGEQQKTLASVEWICEQLAQLHCDRQTSLVAVGGGVLGDMVGLAASVFMRGIKLYHVPTTLLAMVDSSIGGKNGVDLPSGKNLVGTVYQPEAVVIDPTWLQTLPDAEFSNGMGEVIKHGVLDPKLFTWLEKHARQIQERDLTTLQKMIAMNVQVKAGIVSSDEHENNQRMLLNLGHTFGHAFETLSHYQLPHGQAVAVGLAYASAMTGMPERSRMLALLTEFNLPTSLPKPYSAKAITQTMLTDKKHRGNTITLVLPMGLGDVHIHQNLSAKQIEQFIEAYQQ